MALPFDLEDIVGVALADVLRRAGMIVAVVYGASLTASLGLSGGAVIAGWVEFGSFDPDHAELGPWSLLFSPLSPIFSAWGILYIPVLIGVGFYCVRSESPNLRILVVGAGLAGLLCVLGAPDPDWFQPTWYGMPLGGAVSDPDKLRLIMKSIGFVVVLGCAGASWFLALFLDQRARAEAESHLVGVTLENEQRRMELRERFGTDIADHDDGFIDEP
ncbi:MAG: hypothetical protein AAGI48_12200 [Verrucomicrobiota bacterium]